MKRWIILATFAACAAQANEAPPATPAPDPAAEALAHAQQLEAWRAERKSRLAAPHGWLSLVGLHWLDPKAGTQRVGRGADNDIVLTTGPERLGVIAFEEKRVSFTPAQDAGVTVDMRPRNGAVELRPDSASQPTTLGFDNGEATAQLIERGGRFGLRVRDARAPTRTGFSGLQYFPSDLAWRFDARFEPHPEGKTIPIANVIGQLEAMKNPGAVVFSHGGKEHRLEAIDEGDGQLFLIFADRSNGKDTYGAGRFLYADAAIEGKTVVDFNKAYNPPCAFNAYSTCPLPPPENRLDLAVTAGEKKYGGPTN